MLGFCATQGKWHLFAFFCMRGVAFEIVASTEEHYAFPNVCIFAAVQQQGTISFPTSVVPKSISFTHKSGKVRCCNDPCSYTNWGCSDFIGVVMTKHDNSKVILPTIHTEGVSGINILDGSVAEVSEIGSLWYKVEGTFAESTGLHWSIDVKTIFDAGSYDIWYNEALTGHTISDNDGWACYDIDVISVLCEGGSVWNASMQSCTKRDRESTNFESDTFARPSWVIVLLAFVLLCMYCCSTRCKREMASLRKNSLHAALLDRSSEPEWLHDLQVALHPQTNQILQAINVSQSREPQWLQPLLSKLDNTYNGAQWLSLEAVEMLPSALSRTCEEDVSSASSFIIVGSMAHDIPSSSPSEAPEQSEPDRDRIGCFLPRTYFISHSSTEKTCLPIEDLKPAMLVCDAFGGYTEVKSINVKICEECDVVQLVVGNGIPPLTTTASHRVATQVAARSCHTVPAGELKVGDRILCSGGEQILQEVNASRKRNMTIYEIIFKPDMPVNAFDEILPGETIASKGMKMTRRSGRKRDNIDSVSVPDTVYEWPATISMQQ